MGLIAEIIINNQKNYTAKQFDFDVDVCDGNAGRIRVWIRLSVQSKLKDKAKKRLRNQFPSN